LLPLACAVEREIRSLLIDELLLLELTHTPSGIL